MSDSSIPNILLVNQGNLNFVAPTFASAVVSGRSATGQVALADLDNDGDLDVLVAATINEVYMLVHCPNGVRFGTSQACGAMPTNSRRGVASDQAFECDVHYTASTGAYFESHPLVGRPLRPQRSSVQCAHVCRQSTPSARNAHQAKSVLLVALNAPNASPAMRKAMGRQPRASPASLAR